jgi:hypothetical protein
MNLVWVKVGAEILVGEASDLLSVMGQKDSVNQRLFYPMTLQVVNVMNPSRIHGQKPQPLRGFNFVPIPCSEIMLDRVDYAGIIRERDPVYTTYYQVQKAVEEQAELLKVNQS